MDLPMFALHSVLYPGQRLGLRVFEERYLEMMEDVLPEGAFAVVAIRHGQEVAGPYEPYDVGVRVAIDDYEFLDDGTYQLEVVGRERVRLLAPAVEARYPVWRTEPFPDRDDASREEVDAATAAWLGFLRTAGVTDDPVFVADDPVTASYALAATTPGLVPERQALLEIAGTGERLRTLRERLRKEAGLLRALRGRAGNN
jgi:Lon protease-like protein